MTRLTAAARRALPKSAFAVPSKAPGPGSYPIPDRAHAAVAKGRAAQFASPKVEAAVDRKANAKLGKTQHHNASHPGMAYRHTKDGASHPGVQMRHEADPTSHPGMKHR